MLDAEIFVLNYYWIQSLILILVTLVTLDSLFTHSCDILTSYKIISNATYVKHLVVDQMIDMNDRKYNC